MLALRRQTCVRYNIQGEAVTQWLGSPKSVDRVLIFHGVINEPRRRKGRIPVPRVLRVLLKDAVRPTSTL